MTYTTQQDRQARRRAERRERAILKLANGKAPECAVCGCPHKEILHIGHPEHRGGRFHRREIAKDRSRTVVGWILNTPIEEVLKVVQLECPYCNAWHNRFKEYPAPEKRPFWGLEE